MHIYPGPQAHLTLLSSGSASASARAKETARKSKANKRAKAGTLIHLLDLDIVERLTKSELPLSCAWVYHRLTYEDKMATDTLYTLLVAFVTIVAILYGLRLLVNVAVRGIHMRVGRISPWSFRNFEWNYWVQIMDDQYEQTGIRQTKVPTRLKGSKRRLFQIRIGRVGIRIRPSFAQLKQLVFGRASPSDPDSDPERSKIHLPPNVENIWLSLIVQDVVIHIDRIGWIVAYLKRKKSRQQEANKEPGARTSTIRRLTAKLPKIPMTTIAGAITYPLIMLWPVQFTLTIFTQIVKLISAIPAQFFISGLANYVDVRIIGIRVEIGQAGTTDGHDQTCNERGFTLTLSGIRIGSVLYSDLLRTRVVGKASNTSTGNAMPTLATHELPVSKSPRSSLNISGAGGESDYPTAATTDTDVSDGHSGVPTNNARSNVARQSQSKRYHQHSNTESHQQHSLKNTRHLFRDKLMEVGLLIGPVELTLTDDNAQRPKNRSHSTPLSPFHLPNPTTFLVLCHLSATCTTLKGVSIEAVFDTFKSNLDTVMRIVEPIKKASKSKQESSHSEGNFPSPSIPSERPLSKDNHQADQSPTSTSIPQIPDPFNDSHAAKHAIASRRSKRWIDSVGISLHRVHLDFSGMNDVVKERLDKATSRQEAGETEFPSANHLPWPAFHLQFSSLIARAILKRSRRGKSTFFGNQDDLKVNGANVSSIYVGYDIAHDALPELNTWDQHDIEGDDIYRNSETESSKREAMHAIWSAQMSLASLDITPTSAIADRAHCPSKSSWFSISSFSVSCQHLRRPKPIAKRSLGVLRRPRRLSLRWEGNPELHSGPTTPDGQNHFAWSQLASPSNEVWRPDMARFEPQPTIQTPIPAPNPSIHNPNDNLYLFSLDTKSTHINIDASYITQLQAISRSKSATTGNTSSTYPTNFVKSKVSKTLSNLPRIAARARLCNSAIVLHYGPRYKAENIPQQPPNQPTFPYLDAVVFSSHSIVLNASGRYRPPMVSSSLIRSQSLADGLHISGLTNESILPPIQGIPQTPIDSPNPTNLDSLIDMQLLSAPPSSEPFTYPINDEHRPYSPPSASLSTPSSPPLSVAQTPVQADNQSPSPTLQVAQKTMPDAAPSRRKSRWSFKPSLRFFNRGTPSGTQGSLSSEASKLVTACDAHSYHMDFSIQLESINLAMKGPEDTTSPLGRDKEDSKKCSLFQLGSFRVNCGISAKSSEETGDTTNKLSLFDRLRFKKSAYLDPGSWTTYLSSQSSKLTLVVNMDDLLVDFTGSDGAPTLADIELLRTSVLPQTKTRSKGEQKRTSDKRYINPLTRDILGILDAQLIISHVIVRFAGIDKENTTEPPAGMLNSAPQHGSISAGLQLSVPNSMVRWIGRSIPSEKSTSVPTQSTQLAEPDQVGAIKTNTSSIVLLPLLLDAKKHLIVLDPGKIVEAHRQACGCVSISDLTITSTIDSTNSVLSPSNQITATTDVGNVYTVYTLPFHYCTLIALASLSDLLSSPKGREREIPQTQATNDAKTEFKHQLSFSLTAFKLRANIPGGLVLLLSVTMLKADSGAIERPISFEQLRLQGVSALQKDSWVDLVCIDTVKVYTPQKTETSEHASADQESKLSVSAALFHLRIPYKYVYADIVDYGVNLFKTIKSLHNRIVAKKEFLIDGPIVQDDPVKIACIAFQLARLEMEIEDDPFECKLSTNWKLGLEEQKARLARLAAYQQKIEELAAQAEYPARADNLGELMTASPSLGPAHRSDSVTSLNSLCTAASEPILPSSGLADEKVRPGVRHRLSAHSAKQRLDEYDSKSWIRIIQLDSGYFQSTSPVAKQGDHIQQRDSQRSFKEFLEDACFNGEVQPRPSAPPLLRMAFDRMHLRISPPTFDLANTRRFMHDVGNGVPLDTHFSTLIPVRLEIRCGRTIATLRDYPLPLLHVPSCQNEGAGNVESWRLQGDYCFGDEIGDEGAIGHVNTVIISKAFASTYAAFNYEVTIPRCPSPPKFYSVVHIEVVTPRPTRLAWSVSVQPAIQDVSKIFDTITRPPIDPSPKVGFWDKIRLMIHSRTQIDFVGGGDFVFSLKGSRDPYAFTGRAAGVTKTWKKDACIRVGFKNVESELIQIYSSSYLLSVPNLSKDDWIYTASSDDKTMKNGWTVNSETIGDDAVSTSHKSPIANDLPQDDELAAKLEEYGLVNDIYDKVILKLNGAVRWGIGAHFERTCLRGCKVCGGRFQCRSQSFRPHYDIKYLTPASAAKRYVETGRMNDAFEGFRSDFIHFAVGVSGTSATPNERNSLTFQNSMHLSSKFLSHFLQLWRLFGGEMSLPIRAGNLFPRADPRPNLKFGKKLSTMKFIIHVQPLNLAYILKEDDFQTMESAVVEGGGDAVGLKGRADSFGVDVHMRREWRTVDTPHLGERVKPSWPIHEAEINVTDADLRAIRANYYSSGRDWQGTILGDFEDDVTDGTTNAIRRGSNSEANEATWLDFDDFVELDLRPPEFRPKVQILPLMYTPHVGYIKQNDPQNAEKWAYLNKTHPCIMGKSPDPKAFQMSCLKQRAQAIDDAITEIQEALSNLESKLKLSPYNSQLLEESDTYIEKLSNLLDRRGLLQQCLKSVGGRTPIRRRSTITSPTTPVFEKDFSVSWEDYFGHFEQRYIIQNPKIIWNNALRNLLYHFLDLQVQQRAQTYYLSMRAVKFLRDLTAKASRGSTLNSDLPNTSETDQGFDERMAQELIEKLMSDPNTIAENESQQGQNGTQSNKDGEQMVINDPASQNDSIPDGFTMESNYLVQLLNPQIILQSEKALDAIILMAADGVQIKAFDILDDSISADDYDNQLVKKRTIFSMENTQFFVAHKADFRNERILFDDHYGAGGTQNWLTWVPPELLVDMAGRVSQFQRIANKSSASAQYDAYNPLRLKSINKKPNRFGTNLVPFSERSNSVFIRFPTLFLNANSDQFTVIYEVVSDLLLYKEPARKERLDRLQEILLAADVDHLANGSETVGYLQDQIRFFEELLVHYREMVGSLDEAQLDDYRMIKSSFVQTREELYLMMEAITKAQDQKKENLSDPKTNMKITFQSNEFIWVMMQDSEHPLCEWILSGAHFGWVSKEDHSKQSTLEIDQFRLLNKLEKPVFVEMIAPYLDGKKHVNFSRQKMLRGFLHDLPPVGGISVVQHLEINLFPLKFQMTYDFGKQLIAYIFPEKRKQQKAADPIDKPLESTSADLTIHSGQSLRYSNGSQFDMAHLEIAKLGMAKSPESQPSKVDPLIRQESSSSFQLPLRGSQASTGETTNDNVSSHQFSTDQKRSGKKVAGRLSSNSNDLVEKSDELSLMKSRASQNRTFIYIKIPGVPHCLSYQGPKEKNIEDLYDFVFRQPTLEYRNKTWTYLEFLNQVKKDILRAALAHSGALIKEKFRQRRQHRPENLESPVILSPGHVGIVSKEQIHTKRSLELLEEADEAGSMENETFEASTEDKDKPKGKSGLLSRLLKKESPKATPDVSLVGSEPDSPTSERRNSHPDPQREEEEYREKGRLLLGKFYIAPSAYSASRRSSQSTSSIRSFEHYHALDMTVKADWSPVAQNEDEHESFEEHALDEMDCDSDRLLQEHAYASGRRKRSTHSLSNNAFCLVCNRLFAFVKGRHILSCFTMFVAVSFAYLVVYSFHGEENAVDSVWQGVTGIQYKSLAEWRDEEGGAASSWNCSSTGEGLDAERTRICEYRNFCVDVDRGGFLIQKSNSTHQELPTVNIMASPKERDVYWSAQVFSAPPTTHYGYIDDTVFIYGLDEGEGANLTEGWRSSNAIYEGLLPLWSIMQQYGATSNSWLFRPDPITTIAKKDIRPAPAVDMSYIFPHGREIVLNEDSITTRFQILAPKSTVPMCFARAIVGLGNRCGHDYCSKKISASDVTSLKQQIKGAFAADLEQKETQELAAETGMEFNFLPNVTIVNYSYESRVENLKDLERPLREAGFNVRKIELPDGSLLSVLDAVYAFAHSEIIIAPQSPILAQAALFAPEMSTLISISNQQAQPAVSALQTPIRLSGHRTYDSICTASNCTVVSEPVMDKCFEASLLQSYRNDAAYSNAIDMLKLRKTLDQIIAENRAALPAIARPARMQQISDAYGCYTQLAPRHANVSEILKVVSQAALDMGYVMRLVDTGDATDTRPQQLYDAGLDMRTRAAGMAGICRAGRCCGPRVSLPLAIAETMTDCVDDEWGSLTEIQDDLLRSLTTLEEKYAQQEKREIVPIYSAEQSDAKDAKASQRERTIITHAISGEDSTTLLKRKRDDEHVETTNIQDTRANKQHETIKLSTHVTQASPSIKNERTSSFAVTTQYRSPLRAMDMNRNDHQQPTTFPSLKSPLGSLKLSRIQARQVTPSKHFVAPRSVVNTKAEQQIPTRPEREREKKQFTVYQSTQPPPSPSPQPHILEQQVDTSQLGEESQSETRLGEVVHDRQASPQRGATISLPEVRTPFQDDPGTPSERCSQELPITFDEFDDDVADLGDILESSIDAIESTSALMTCAAALPQRSTSSSLQSSINLGLQDIENLTATYGGFKTGHNKTLTVKVSSTHVAAFSSQGSSQDGCVNPGTPTNLKQLAARALHGGQ